MNKKRKNRLYVYVIMCVFVLLLGMVFDAIISSHMAKLRKIEEKKEAQKKQEEVEEQQEIEEQRIRKIKDIPSVYIDKMIQYTSDDLSAKMATPSNAVYNVCDNAIDNKYGMVSSVEGGNTIATSWWMANKGSTTIQDWHLYQSFLFCRKDDPNIGVLRLVYKISIYTDFNQNMAAPINDSTLSEDVYTSYCYDIDLSNPELIVTDYNNYEFDGRNMADIDYDNWRNKNVTAYKDKWEVLDEFIYE